MGSPWNTPTIRIVLFTLLDAIIPKTKIYIIFPTYFWNLVSAFLSSGREL